MDEQQVAALLVNDVQTHFAWFQFAVIFIALALILVSVALASRAYAALSEARILFYRASERDDGAVGARLSGRVATSETINAASRARKVRTRRGRTIP